MRAQLLLVAFLAGCGSTGVSAGWARSGKLPEEPTPEEQLREIRDWAKADGSATALTAGEQAVAGLQRKAGTAAADRERISRAWSHARAATRPGLEPQEKERLWTLCAHELTHGAGG